MPGGQSVATVYSKTVEVERLVSALSSASSELIQVLSSGAGDARIRKGFNASHITSLVERGLQLRAAAKQFLVQVLVNSDCLSCDADDVTVEDAGVLGQGLFAVRDIGAGCKIGEYHGEQLDTAGLAARYGAIPATAGEGAPPAGAGGGGSCRRLKPCG